jgi:hypothetical protein
MYRKISQQFKSPWIFIYVLSTSLSFYAFRETHKIGFGPVDDHEIIRFLGPDRDLNFIEIFRILFNETEVGEWGTSGRYRPTYYTIRLLETFAFASREHLWFIFRASIAATTTVFLTLILFRLCKNLSKTIRLIICSSFSLLTLSVKSWPDLVMRLGPSEIFLVAGVAAFLYLSVYALLEPTRYRIWLGALVIATLTTGTKENAAVILPAAAFFVFLSHKMFAINRSQKVQAGVLGTLGFSIVLIPVINSVNNSVDVYGNSRDIIQFWTHSLDYFVSSSGVRNFILFAFALILLRILYKAKILEPRLVSTHIYVLILMSLVPLTEYIFYQGMFTEPRYQILTDLTELMLFFIVLTLIIEGLHALKINTFIRMSVTAATFSILFTISSMQYLDSVGEFELTASQKIDGNNKFSDQISRIDETLKNGDFDSVVLIVNNVWEYEPIFTTSHFITYLYGEIPKYLQLNEMSISPGLEQKLLDQMNGFSTDGSEEWGITNGPVPKSNETLCVALQIGDVDPNICDDVIISE